MSLNLKLLILQLACKKKKKTEIRAVNVYNPIAVTYSSSTNHTVVQQYKQQYGIQQYKPQVFWVCWFSPYWQDILCLVTLIWRIFILVLSPYCLGIKNTVRYQLAQHTVYIVRSQLAGHNLCQYQVSISQAHCLQCYVPMSWAYSFLVSGPHQLGTSFIIRSNQLGSNFTGKPISQAITLGPNYLGT